MVGTRPAVVKLVVAVGTAAECECESEHHEHVGRLGESRSGR